MSWRHFLDAFEEDINSDKLTCGSLECLGLPRWHGSIVWGPDSEAEVLVPG